MWWVELAVKIALGVALFALAMSYELQYGDHDRAS